MWFYNYLTGRIEYFNVEMDNSSSELRRLLHQEDRVSRRDLRPAAAIPAATAIRIGRSTMAMDVGGARGGLKSDINVTPLVDVMLVLLIIMMLIAPMLQQGVAVHDAGGGQHRRQTGHPGPDGRRGRLARRVLRQRAADRRPKSDPAGPARPRGQDGKDRLPQG